MKILILILMLAITPIVYGLETNTSGLTINFFSSSGGVESNHSSLDISYGTGQTHIARTEAEDTTHLIGLYYINKFIPYSSNILPPLIFSFNISDYGMEWIKLNWITN